MDTDKPVTVKTELTAVTHAGFAKLAQALGVGRQRLYAMAIIYCLHSAEFSESVLAYEVKRNAWSSFWTKDAGKVIG